MKEWNTHWNWNELVDQKGFNSGKHLLSIKNNCNILPQFCSIGITTNQWDKPWIQVENNAIKEWVKQKSNKDCNYYDGSKHGLRTNDVITIKLDCDEGEVSYYKNAKQIKIDKIYQNEYYYFAMYITVSRNTPISFEIVANPILN